MNLYLKYGKRNYTILEYDRLKYHSWHHWTKDMLDDQISKETQTQIMLPLIEWTILDKNSPKKKQMWYVTFYILTMFMS